MPDPDWRGPTNQLIEDPTSPQITYADKATRVRTYRGLHSLCVASALPKGTVGTGDEAGYIVASSVVTRERGRIGRLVITWEAGGEGGGDSGVSLPPDEFSFSPFELNPPLSYHSRYSSLTSDQVKAVLKALQASLDGSDTFRASFTSLQRELLEKMERGRESFYLAGIRYSWTSYLWFGSGTVTTGGFVEIPGGPLTAFFPAGIQFLRIADELTWTGQYFRYTRNWLGGPAGHWDTDIYA